ncbi:MAG TPA: hypothetical protein VGS22_03530 [Thermoanaerobaculia bacterium]|nr:hypothetical protein [Thermoanaerobaculia bacterium]
MYGTLMVENREDLERRLVTEILRSVHSDSMRIADSAQRDLHFLIRERIDSLLASGKKVDAASIRASIQEFSERIRQSASEIGEADRRLVLRKSFIGRVIKFFERTWPFGE